MQKIEKKPMRIVFMGTPEFAVTILDRILQAGHEVAGVVTAADKPAGRGRKLRSSAVKTYAEKAGLPILQPLKLKDPQFLEALAAWKADVQVVVAFRMLPAVVWQMPTQGTFNLHASLLPQYRGAAPIQWAIINGEQQTGVTTFFIDEKIDTGAIILKKETDIDPKETAASLHDKLMHLGAKAVIETLEKIEQGKVETSIQKNASHLKEAPKLFKNNTKINWNLQAKQIDCFIRGLYPYPTAWSQLKDGERLTEFKVHEAGYFQSTHQQPVGSLQVEKDKLRVFVPDGYMELYKIQLSGKKAMYIKDLLNGYKLSNKTLVGDF
ncbi:MAG: methionyl-tRNA formyltransferase [Flavobacteriaceae bacterium]|nr:methionyl-tRNA formyltransferase [Flavobacteriaceae bacterium]